MSMYGVGLVEGDYEFSITNLRLRITVKTGSPKVRKLGDHSPETGEKTESPEVRKSESRETIVRKPEKRPKVRKSESWETIVWRPEKRPKDLLKNSSIINPQS